MPEINENDVQVVTDGSPIQYFVSSCLTVTCGFADGTVVGAHFSQGVRGPRWRYADSVATWTAFSNSLAQQIVQRGPVTWVLVRGDLDGWNPGYLTTAPLATDYATRGDLRATVSAVTGYAAPDIAEQTGDITVIGGVVAV